MKYLILTLVLFPCTFIISSFSMETSISQDQLLKSIYSSIVFYANTKTIAELTPSKARNLLGLAQTSSNHEKKQRIDDLATMVTYNYVNLRPIPEIFTSEKINANIVKAEEMNRIITIIYTAQSLL